MEPTLDETNIRRGAADFRSKGRKASVTLTAPTQLTARISRNAFRALGFLEKMPALLTRMSSRSYLSKTSLAAASTELSSVTSI